MAEVAKKERKPRASIDELLKAEFAKIQKLYSRQAKAQAKDKGEDVGCDEETNTAKKDAIKAIDDQIDALKKIRKMVKKI